MSSTRPNQSELFDNVNSASWETRFNEVAAECQRLREELDQVKAERDVYLKSLFALTRKEYSLSKEEALSYVGQGQPLRQIIEEIAREEGIG